MIEILLAIAIFTVLNVSILAMFLKLCRVQILEIGFGVGPKIFKKGKVKIGLLPISGWVETLDSRTKELNSEELKGAFNHKPWMIQVLVPLSGCATLLLVCYLIAGNSAITSFVSAFEQIFYGTLFPLTHGKQLVGEIEQFLDQQNLFNIIIVVQTKMIAFNLIPLGGLNGGQAFVSLIKMGKPSAKWEEGFYASFVIVFLIFFAWIIAFVSYLL